MKKKKYIFSGTKTMNYTFEQKLEAAEIIVTKVLTTVVKHLIHVFFLIALAAYNLGKLVGKYYYKETESIRAVKCIAANIHTTDEEMDVYDPWMDVITTFEEEIDRYCEKVHIVSKIHDLETQYLLPPADDTSLGYIAPKRGRCRKGYRRVGNQCVPINALVK